MKVNVQNTITCRLTNKEKKLFEDWATGEGIVAVNQAIKRAIAVAIQAKNAEQASVST
jgi:hypothetical protein